MLLDYYFYFSVLCLSLKVQDFCRFKPCFPGVPCFNDPATQLGFECGECPLGMLGDGVNCTDVDEVTARQSNNRKGGVKLPLKMGWQNKQNTEEPPVRQYALAYLEKNVTLSQARM